MMQQQPEAAPADRRSPDAPFQRLALTAVTVLLAVAGLVSAIGQFNGGRREPAWSARLGPLAGLPAVPGTVVAIALPAGATPDQSSKLVMEAACLRPDLYWGVLGAWTGNRPAEAIVTLGYGQPPPHSRLVWSKGVVSLWRP